MIAIVSILFIHLRSFSSFSVFKADFLLRTLPKATRFPFFFSLLYLHVKFSENWPSWVLYSEVLNWKYIELNRFSGGLWSDFKVFSIMIIVIRFIWMSRISVQMENGFIKMEKEQRNVHLIQYLHWNTLELLEIKTSCNGIFGQVGVCFWVLSLRHIIQNWIVLNGNVKYVCVWMCARFLLNHRTLTQDNWNLLRRNVSNIRLQVFFSPFDWHFESFSLNWNVSYVYAFIFLSFTSKDIPKLLLIDRRQYF